METVPGKWDRVRYLVRRLADADLDSHIIEQVADSTVEVGDRLRLERDSPFGAPARANEEPVCDEIKLHLEGLADRSGSAMVPSPRAVTYSGTCQL